MRNIRLVAVATTCGSPWYVMLAAGFPGKHLLRRAFRLGYAIRCRNIWMCLYAIDKIDQMKREKHLARIERRFARIR